MNQVLKTNVYGLGSMDDVKYLEIISGMNKEEAHLYELYHDGISDLDAQTEMSLDPKAFDRIEKTMRTKFAVGIASCVTYRRIIDKE